MKALEVSQDGERLFVAGLRKGVVESRLIIRNQADPVWFDVRGRDASNGAHAVWTHLSLEVRESITIRLVDVDDSEIALLQEQ